MPPKSSPNLAGQDLPKNIYNILGLAAMFRKNKTFFYDANKFRFFGAKASSAMKYIYYLPSVSTLNNYLAERQSLLGALYR